MFLRGINTPFLWSPLLRASGIGRRKKFIILLRYETVVRIIIAPERCWLCIILRPFYYRKKTKICNTYAIYIFIRTCNILLKYPHTCYARLTFAAAPAAAAASISTEPFARKQKRERERRKKMVRKKNINH